MVSEGVPPASSGDFCFWKGDMPTMTPLAPVLTITLDGTNTPTGTLLRPGPCGQMTVASPVAPLIPGAPYALPPQIPGAPNVQSALSANASLAQIPTISGYDTFATFVLTYVLYSLHSLMFHV